MATGAVVWSDELYRIHGLAPRAMETQDAVAGRVHPEDRPVVEKAIRDAMGTASSFEFDHRIRRGDGATRILRTRGRCETDAAGNVARIVGTLQDVTELREAHMQARELERLKEMDAFRADFISKAAHELRTPLLPIRIQSHILGTALAERGDATLRRSLETLERNLDRLNRLVDDLLEASRLQSARLRLERLPFELGPLLKEASETFAPVAEQVGVRIDWRPRAGVVVDADPQRVLQVLHNLLGNALKFTPAGGVVTVDVATAGPAVRIRVTDTGPGFGPEEAPTLFQPFAQAGAGRESRAPGTGLGLYVSRGIAEQHGGRLTAESPGRGQGATFILELPLTHRPAQPLPGTVTAGAWWRDAGPAASGQRYRELI